MLSQKRLIQNSVHKMITVKESFKIYIHRTKENGRKYTKMLKVIIYVGNTSIREIEQFFTFLIFLFSLMDKYYL